MSSMQQSKNDANEATNTIPARQRRKNLVILAVLMTFVAGVFSLGIWHAAQESAARDALGSVSAEQAPHMT